MSDLRFARISYKFRSFMEYNEITIPPRWHCQGLRVNAKKLGKLSNFMKNNDALMSGSGKISGRQSLCHPLKSVICTLLDKCETGGALPLLLAGMNMCLRSVFIISTSIFSCPYLS
uniref:Uncharacterized protein n=1 Tax=Schistocephalus solidus TaxID=70667 RepID=A0A0X3NZK9_SCHSO